MVGWLFNVNWLNLTEKEIPLYWSVGNLILVPPLWLVILVPPIWLVGNYHELIYYIKGDI